MSLQARFAMLFLMLGVAAFIAVGGAWWSFQTISREVREPFREMSTVLRLLSDAKGHVEAAGSLVNRTHEDALAAASDSIGSQGARPWSADVPLAALDASESAQLMANLDGFDQAMAELDELDSAAMVSGKATLANIRQRSPIARELMTRWLKPNSAQEDPRVARRAASIELYRLHNLIERIEQRIVSSTEVTLQHSQDMRSRLNAILGFSLLIGALCSLLGIFQVRRWVLRPVEELRIAAAKIASGDFAHRVPVPRHAGADELALLSIEVNHMSSTVKSLQDERVERERLAALGEMVRRIVHNLRNPLSGIRGLAEVSKADLAGLGADTTLPGSIAHVRSDLRENQERIIASVDRFERWLADLLRATRPAEIHTAPCNALNWVQGVADVYLATARSRGVDLTVVAAGPPETVWVDGAHLEHALGAIIANAIDAVSALDSPPKWVRITATTPHRTGPGTSQASEVAQWEIRIEDSGPGIPPEMHERVFAPYFTTKREGTGIGLATALQVVRAHAGKILLDRVTNPVDAPSGQRQRPGACFRVLLPVRPDVARDSQVARIGQSGAVGGQNTDH